VQVSDRVSGFLLTALGAVTYYGGSLLPPVPGQQVGPSAFPMVIGAALVICGILITLGVGKSFEEAEKIVVSIDGSAQAAAPEQTLPWTQKLQVLVPPLCVLLYALVSEKVGFWLTIAIIVSFMAWSMKAKWQHIVWLVLLAPPFMHLIFYKLLRVPLPRGWLMFPWA
jgi:putative tricarboxylic transport membrane protein